MYQRDGRSTWYAYLDRKRRHISLGTDDEEQARINFADLIHRRAAEGHAPKKGELGEVFLACAERAEVNHTRKYAYDLNNKLELISRWLDAQGVRDPGKVTPGLVEAYKADARTRGLTDRSINRYLDVWKKAMKHAVEDGVAPPRVLASFRKLREPRPEPHQRGLTMDEIDSFLCAVEDERDFFLFRTVAGSGIRDDEVRHLLPESVRETSIVVTPQPSGTCQCHPRGWTTKSYRYRAIPVSHEAAEAARRYTEVKHSMNLDGKAIWRRLQAARVAAGHDWDWSMHELRRAWGSHMLAAGHKLANISKWYGHADIKTTMRYLRIVEDEMPDPDALPL